MSEKIWVKKSVSILVDFFFEWKNLSEKISGFFCVKKCCFFLSGFSVSFYRAIHHCWGLPEWASDSSSGHVFFWVGFEWFDRVILTLSNNSDSCPVILPIVLLWLPGAFYDIWQLHIFELFYQLSCSTTYCTINIVCPLQNHPVIQLNLNSLCYSENLKVPRFGYKLYGITVRFQGFRITEWFQV